MDPQNQGSRFETPPSGPAYPPPAYSQAHPVAGAQPDIAKRAIAAVIDFAIIGVGMMILSFALVIVMRGFGSMIASVAALAAVLVRDVAFQGRSFGKKVMGLAAVNAAGGPITLEQSVKRNATLAIGMVGSVVAIVPILGWIAAIALWFAGFAAWCYEIYLVATGKPRYGDQIAGTHVVVESQPAIAV
jgi:uncharacterized RDD family membrane protein YckC